MTENQMRALRLVGINLRVMGTRTRVVLSEVEQKLSDARHEHKVILTEALQHQANMLRVLVARLDDIDPLFKRMGVEL